MTTDNLDIITGLSHEFGADFFVKGGGGNTSTKDDKTLWVKPSGTTLAGLTRDSFVVMDRAAIGELYAIETPKDWTAREALVKDVMAKAVRPDSTGRPSVEAPLHNSLDATFVVHTHPSLVNGLTCAVNGEAECRKLFPNALWMDFIDPGYMLCMVVREEIEKYKAAHGGEPKMIFLKNHGVFVAGESADEIRRLYGEIMDTLKGCYTEAGIDWSPVGTTEVEPQITASATARAKAALGDDVCVAVAKDFTPVDGPLTPDHVVYAKAYVMDGEPTADKVKAYVEKHGHTPRVLTFDGIVATVGAAQKQADLALTMAMDGAQVADLTKAFGGLEMMSQTALDFINNWEVESYRTNVLTNDPLRGG